MYFIIFLKRSRISILICNFTIVIHVVVYSKHSFQCRLGYRWLERNWMLLWPNTPVTRRMSSGLSSSSWLTICIHQYRTRPFSGSTHLRNSSRVGCCRSWRSNSSLTLWQPHGADGGQAPVIDGRIISLLTPVYYQWLPSWRTIFSRTNKNRSFKLNRCFKCNAFPHAILNILS